MVFGVLLQARLLPFSVITSCVAVHALPYIKLVNNSADPEVGVKTGCVGRDLQCMLSLCGCLMQHSSRSVDHSIL